MADAFHSITRCLKSIEFINSISFACCYSELKLNFRLFVKNQIQLNDANKRTQPIRDAVNEKT